MLLPSGELNRPALRSLVFADDAKRRKLESILHPLIRSRTRAKLAELEAPYALVAVPLLVETSFGELVDRILVVDCPESAQLERLMRRDAIPTPEALAMLRAQVDRATRLKPRTTSSTTAARPRRRAGKSRSCIDVISISPRSALDEPSSLPCVLRSRRIAA